MSDTKKDPLANVFTEEDAAELARFRKEKAEREKAANAPKSPAQIKAALELKYARQCRRETPHVNRGGNAVPVKGSDNCADHKTNGTENFTAVAETGDETPVADAARQVWGGNVADHKRNGKAVTE